MIDIIYDEIKMLDTQKMDFPLTPEVKDCQRKYNVHIVFV